MVWNKRLERATPKERFAFAHLDPQRRFSQPWCEGQWEPGLILQDLRRQHSREAQAFTVIVHQKRTRQI